MADSSAPVVIVGGGIAGLATAVYLAQAGQDTVILERAKEIGGRAQTKESKGFHFNLGPHALYAAGAGRAVLDELGIEVSGHYPPKRGLYGIRNGERFVLPSGPGSLVRTGLLGWRDKLELLGFLAKLPKLDTTRYASMTAREWLDNELESERTRELVEALFRVATYANAPSEMGAEAALEQLQLAVTGNVVYLDGGWQTIVDGLRTKARAAGVCIETGASVAEVWSDGVVLADGRELATSAVVLAAGPAEVSRLTSTNIELTPIRAACLDVALERTPDPSANFALGIDEPLYLSRHSSTARLAPTGGAMIHVARYLAPGESATAEPLESLLDAMQPGWRDVVVERRFLPKMTVSHAVVPPGGRPTNVDMVGMNNVYVAGDWVGPDGMLADAAFASARRVAGCLGAVEATRAA